MFGLEQSFCRKDNDHMVHSALQLGSVSTGWTISVTVEGIPEAANGATTISDRRQRSSMSAADDDRDAIPVGSCPL
jgi:hypothetical protein